jgi:predicted alpha/beta superfamily hydrolase
MIARTWPVIASCLATLVAACDPPSSQSGVDASSDPDADPSLPDADPDACAAGPAGAPCVIALADAAIASCDPAQLARLHDELDSRRGWLPLWHAGRALFAADAPVDIAGSWDGWTRRALPAPCGGARHVDVVAIASGHHQYKIVDGAGAWHLDPENLAFAYDDFAGNQDGRNSVLNTPDSGVGHLIAFAAPACSSALGNCREVTAYLPRGYLDPDDAAADRRYPTIYMHDGQNVFDDQTCCFGHTGWEINRAIDRDVADGAIEETIVVAAAHAGVDRNPEYGWTIAGGGRMETFMTFQVDEIQPLAEAALRVDPSRRFVAGSSLGGLVSMHLALAYPGTYAGAASLSGAFWPGQDTGTALRDALPSIGKVDVAIYLDHGGSAGTGSDGYFDSIEIRDLMVTTGWQRADSPACTRGPDALCYHHEPGATHDELAWRDRAWRFLRFLVGG